MVATIIIFILGSWGPEKLNNWYEVKWPAINIDGIQAVSWGELNKTLSWGFPGGAVVESLPAGAGDMGSNPGLGRSHMPRSN